MDYASAAMSAARLVGELIGLLQKSKDSKAKQMAETLKTHVEILTTYVAALEKDRASLKLELADQEKELKQLRESLAAYELSKGVRHSQRHALRQENQGRPLLPERPKPHDFDWRSHLEMYKMFFHDH